MKLSKISIEDLEKEIIFSKLANKIHLLVNYYVDLRDMVLMFDGLEREFRE